MAASRLASVKNSATLCATKRGGKNLSCGQLNGAHAFVMRHILSILPAFPVIKLVVVGSRH